MISSQNRMVTLNIDNIAYKIKPEKYEVGAIQDRLSLGKTIIGVDELAELLGKGHAMKAAALEGGSSNQNWISQEVFGLDIDNSDKCIKRYGYITIEDALSRCKDYNLDPSFYYTTFSHTEELHKFRLVFISSTKVEDVRVRSVIQMALMNIFPEADVSCKDLARLFYGGPNGSVILDSQATVNPHSIVESMVNYIQITDSVNAARNIKNYCRTVGLNTVNGLPSVFEVEKFEIEENEHPLIVYILEEAPNLQNHIKLDFNISANRYSALSMTTEGKKSAPKVDIENSKMKSQRLIENFNFEQLTDECQLAQDFFNGEIIGHGELFGIATALWRYKGAQSKMVELIEINDEYTSVPNKINTIKYVAKKQYYPKRCSNFCPYFDECHNCGLNMLHLVDAKRREIRKIEDVKTVTLDKAQAETIKLIRDGLYSEENILRIIGGDPGVGKTRMIIELAKENPEVFMNTVVALPNHNILREVVSKIEPHLPNMLYVGEIEIEDENIQQRYDTYQTTGQYRKAQRELHLYIKKLISSTEPGTLERVEAEVKVKEVKDYIQATKEAKTTNRPIFCTHKRVTILGNSNVKKYIMDEDIISTVNQTITINRDEVVKARNLAQELKLVTLEKQFGSLVNLLSEVETTQNTAVRNPYLGRMIPSKEITTLLERYTPKCNLVEVLKVKALVRTGNGVITGSIKNNIPNKPTMILSATANEALYRSFFAKRKVEYIYTGSIKTLGKVVLHYGGMSRNYLNQYMDKAVERIREEAPGIKNIITFKRFSEKFKEKGFTPICHYGLTTGIDEYGGKDLVVVGTPHCNIAGYLLLADACGLEEATISEMDFVPVKKNGYEYSFNTFNNNDLSESGELIREIQDYMISSEIIQAVGRARIIRNNCTVHLFSNYPVKGCILYK